MISAPARAEISAAVAPLQTEFAYEAVVEIGKRSTSAPRLTAIVATFRSPVARSKASGFAAPFCPVGPIGRRTGPME